ncbi:hypothetical protein NDU88_003101 [Pleurodeles waltl]|uniref:Uncharacterized protein n=1 Tax=Pleurodeles waltl TaxID=8319 RepID=A0AAV7UBK3_PLEWA|nr:hypothetical protein NDU88_003101 [Pleurodeles waltl]
MVSAGASDRWSETGLEKERKQVRAEQNTLIARKLGTVGPGLASATGVDVGSTSRTGLREAHKEDPDQLQEERHRKRWM